MPSILNVVGPPANSPFCCAFNGDAGDAVGRDKCCHLSGEGFDVRGVFIVVEGDFFGADGDVLKAGLALTGQGEDGFAAFDVDTANSHKSPIRH